MLTKKQHDLLVFIDQRINETGISPSFHEMKDALGLKSKSGVHRLIGALEERGFLRRLPNRARALEVLQLPADQRRENRGGFTPSVIEGGRGAAPTARGPAPRPVSALGEFREVPVMNKIAAGLPIEASEGHIESMMVPASLIPASGDFYALTVDGDSMIEAGINDGDTVIVERTDRANNGDIVVAFLHDENMATLKTLRMAGDTIELEAENANYETQRYAANAVSIQGRLAALMRSYRH